MYVLIELLVFFCNRVSTFQLRFWACEHCMFECVSFSFGPSAVSSSSRQILIAGNCIPCCCKLVVPCGARRIASPLTCSNDFANGSPTSTPSLATVTSSSPSTATTSQAMDEQGVLIAVSTSSTLTPCTTSARLQDNVMTDPGQVNDLSHAKSGASGVTEKTHVENDNGSLWAMDYGQRTRSSQDPRYLHSN